jgi:ribonuclease D
MGVCHPRTLEIHGQAILATVEETLSNGLKVKALKTLGPSHRPLVAGMKALVRRKSAELSVEPALLASKRELEGLILLEPDEPIPERYRGWRKEIITNELLALKDKHSQ